MATTPDLVVAAGDVTGECPLWDGVSASLYWLDIGGRRVHRLEPGSGRHHVAATPGRVGSMSLRRDGGMIAAMEHAFGTLDVDTGAFDAWAEPEADRPDNRFNDGRCDPEGQFLAGSMCLVGGHPTGVLWRLDGRRRVSEVASGVTVSNGLAWSPDGRMMYWSDSRSGRVWRFAYDVDEGLAHDRRLWLDAGHAPGAPDGAAVDAEGGYWSARWKGNGLLRFAPDGKITHRIDLPVARVTMCAFAGPDLRDLYITTATEGMTPEEREAEPHAGGLFVTRAPIPGLPEPRFAG